MRRRVSAAAGNRGGHLPTWAAPANSPSDQGTLRSRSRGCPRPGSVHRIHVPAFNPVHRFTPESRHARESSPRDTRVQLPQPASPAPRHPSPAPATRESSPRNRRVELPQPASAWPDLTRIRSFRRVRPGRDGSDGSPATTTRRAGPAHRERATIPARTVRNHPAHRRRRRNPPRAPAVRSHETVLQHCDQGRAPQFCAEFFENLAVHGFTGQLPEFHGTTRRAGVTGHGSIGTLADEQGTVSRANDHRQGLDPDHGVSLRNRRLR